MIRSLPRLAGACVLSLLLASCASLGRLNPLPDLGFDEGAREERAVAERILPYTSRVEVYREFTTVFTARALELAPAVRRAVAEHEAKSRLLDPGEREALERTLLQGGSERLEYLIGFYAPGEDKAPLERKGTEWGVFLLLPDGRRLKADCVALDPKGAPQAGAPYLRFLRWDLSWSLLYRVCFPIAPGDPALAGRPHTLLITGPGGSGEMTFPGGP